MDVDTYYKKYFYDGVFSMAQSINKLKHLQNNMFERVRIKAWKDYKNSDSIQMIDENGKPIYTHLRNVKLTHE